MRVDLATNFGRDLIAGFNGLLDFALSSKSCPFYREKYKGLGIGMVSALEEFSRIPFLEKRELLALPWRERLFVPEEDVEAFGISSGTTDSARPLIIPRAKAKFDYLRARLPGAKFSIRFGAAEFGPFSIPSNTAG